MKQIKLITGLVVLASLFTYFSAKSQDFIIKADKKEIKAKILEIEEHIVKYKKFEFLDGPSYTINKSEVFMIIYKNGTRETFETKALEVKPSPLPVEATKPIIAESVAKKPATTSAMFKVEGERVMYFPRRLWGALPKGGGIFLAAESEYALLPNFMNIGIGPQFSIVDNEYLSSFGYGAVAYVSGFLPVNKLTGNIANQNKGFFPFVRIGPSFIVTDVEFDGTRSSSSSFDLSYGIGVDYKFSEKFGLSVLGSQFKSFGAGINLSF
jgi:hypothetical protein